MDTPALEIKNLVKKYDDKFTAVDDISLSVPKGQFFGFLGPNGAGKTTTINCITGVARITSGTIKVSGIDVVADYRQARKQIGIAPQEFNFEFFGHIQKSLAYIAGYYGMSKSVREDRIAELLEKFELNEYAKKQFNELSGGLKRRVMLVRALVHDPDVVILDEPTAGVDVEMRHDLWRYLQDMNKGGKTIILTSHYLEEVELLCDRVAIISKGNIVADGKKEEFTKDGSKLEDHYLRISKESNGK